MLEKTSSLEEIIISNNELTITDIISFLIKNKITIILITMIFSIGSIIISFLLPEKYQSTAKFISRISNNGDGGLAQMAAIAGINLNVNKSNLDPSMYFADIIQDRGFLLKILGKMWYIKNEPDSVYLEKVWDIKCDTSVENWEYFYESKLVEHLRKGKYISLSKNKKTEVVTLNTLFQTPELALQVNQHILTLLADYMRESFRFQAQEKRRFIENRIVEVFKELEKSENNLTLFRERNINASSPRIIIEEQRLLRNVSLNQELYLQLLKQCELARIEEKNDQPLIEILQNPELPILKASPQRTKLVMIFTLCGFLCSLIVASILNWYKDNYKKDN